MGIYTKGGSINAVISDTSVTRGRYTADSALRVTPVSGSTFTGETAPDGSVNVVSAVDGLRGLYHPSGAIRGFFSNSETTISGLYHRSGALNLYASVSNSTLQLLGEPDGLSLDFIDNTSDIVTSEVSVKDTATGIITFTRASTANRINESGLLESVSSGVPRLDYDPVALTPRGLLIEMQRTNLCLQSNDFNTASWTKTNLTAAKTATGPDGVTNSASTLTATDANATALQAITSTSAARITSTYIKRRTGSGVIELTQDNGTTWTAVTVTSEWTRVSIPSATAANPTVGIRITTNGDEVDVANFQHELGAFITSPITTTTSQVTRNADNASLATSAFPYSSTAGTLVAKFVSTEPTATGQTAAGLTDGTSTNRAIIYASTGVRAFIVASGTTQAFISGGTYSANTLYTAAMGFATNSVQIAVNGTLGTQDTTAVLPTVTTLNIGAGHNNITPLNGWVRQLTYMPRRLSNSELQTRSLQ
jgi:hypothetical protein